jgi:hypothetical protein
LTVVKNPFTRQLFDNAVNMPGPMPITVEPRGVDSALNGAAITPARKVVVVTLRRDDSLTVEREEYIHGGA